MARDPRQADIAETIRHLADAVQAGEAQVVVSFKSDRRSTVQLVEHAGDQYIVKQYHQPGWKTALYHLFCATPAWREIRGARWLSQADVRSNVPLLLRHTGGLFDARQWLILPCVQGQTLYHRVFDDLAPDQWSAEHRRWRQQLAWNLGRQVGTMVDAGLINRDLKPGNLIVDPICDAGEAAPVVIDPLGVRPWNGDIEPVIDMVLTLARSSYQAGGTTRRERLAFLLGLLDADDPTDERRRAWVRQIMHEVTRRLGDPPPKDEDLRPSS